ncbi:MAG: metalloregulator ArsR/SmtB family transcription factor [Acidimicrobiia bacterium]
MMVDDGNSLDGVFDALANPHRRAILHALSLRPHSISQLASIRGLSLPAIHKHIVAMEQAELVIRRKSGRTNFLALNRSPLRQLQEWVGQFNPYWGDERETLENYALDEGSQQPRKR